MKIYFFYSPDNQGYIAVESTRLSLKNIDKLLWLFGDDAFLLNVDTLVGEFICTFPEMITPWCTNAVEIVHNIGISSIKRMEKLIPYDKYKSTIYDPMLHTIISDPSQNLFKIKRKKEPIKYIDDIEKYNYEAGLALSKYEIDYLKYISETIGRPLTDCEVYGFAQVNSEHCRHKIFNGVFVIDNIEQKETLFDLIKATTRANHGKVISAYSDNVAFIEAEKSKIFTPVRGDMPSSYIEYEEELVYSLKAETHNFPTTVEPFYGAATGSGGEIRDRMAGGIGSIPLIGTAVYMVADTRNFIEEKNLFGQSKGRFLYHNPVDTLIKASNGASDFGNKFGQPLICGSLYTYEQMIDDQLIAYDKVIMLAGGIGYALKKYAYKKTVRPGQTVVMMGGDNYRIGMGGGAVSSVATGKYNNSVERNAIQRANPEMQKRVFNVIRALAENHLNPIISINDHGAGGHLNCFAELLDPIGGEINIDALPLGDPSLSDKEIICNESQERMGLVVDNSNYEKIEKIALRECAPIYKVGKIYASNSICFVGNDNRKPFDLKFEYLFGKTPKKIIRDYNKKYEFHNPKYNLNEFDTYLEKVLTNDAVACKDWLTNKVDRSVTGKVALQQTCGKIQLPLNNLAITALDYTSNTGIAISIGHAPNVGIIDPAKGSRLSVAEALTNIVWVPLKDGLEGISLSANWMWPSGLPGEDARLYEAVKSLSDFCIKLKINIPTGKDSLSLSQNYPDGTVVKGPGTVVITASALTNDFTKVVTPDIKNVENSSLIFINFSKMPPSLGGSIFYQELKQIGNNTPDIVDVEYFKRAFIVLQNLINQNLVLAGHDVSAGGLITTLLEMSFANPDIGLDINLASIPYDDIIAILFAENPGVVIQVANVKEVINQLYQAEMQYYPIGTVIDKRELKIIKYQTYEHFDIDKWRDIWYKKSYLYDLRQTTLDKAKERFNNYKKQPLDYIFPKIEVPQKFPFNKDTIKPKAAIIREKGVNGDREMAYCLYLAGFDVIDIHMTDIINGKITLDDISFIVFAGGFSNSDVLGSAKGWAANFHFNERARLELEKFYNRTDTLSLGVCNGCQLMVHLGLLSDDKTLLPKMTWNDSKKFESNFITVDIHKSNSILLKPLIGSRLGVWIAHGEGKFILPGNEINHNIVMKYSYHKYPANPNGSDYDTAAIASPDGRHLAMMPHIERSIFSWQWAYYPNDLKKNVFTPWIMSFISAYDWITKKK